MKTDVQDVVLAIGWIQPTWVDGKHSYEKAKAIADAFRERINNAEPVPDHYVHTLWILDLALEWAEEDRSDDPAPAYVPHDECPWCKSAGSKAS